MDTQDDQRAVRALREISFEIDPGLNTRVKAALFRRAGELAQAQARRRRMLTGLVIALLMTMSGSAAVWEAVVRIAGFSRIAPPVLAAGVVLFWALPSLCATLLLLTPRLLAGYHEEVLAL
ncbi:MAG TPA: hypothetical protein VH988_33825 [Thermoanaerobaculia bacterium]|jgi:hypothetical protein|nr:hypothetical protein [Thermoanaerobaculia bacterium]